jgi:hypothetical protein
VASKETPATKAARAEAFGLEIELSPEDLQRLTDATLRDLQATI